jgi:hypothetical protein
MVCGIAWRLRCVLLGAALPIAALACADGAQDYDAAARVAAEASVLSPTDLPAGWTPAAEGSIDISRADLGLEGACAIFNRANASGFEGEAATAESPAFTGPEGAAVASSATVFIDFESATTAVETAATLIDGCSGDIEDAARRRIDEALNSGEIDGLFTNVNIDFGPEEFPTFGEETRAYRLKASVSALVTLYELTLEVVVLRDGPIVAVLTHFTNDEPDGNPLETLAETAAGKLRTANLALSES